MGYASNMISDKVRDRFWKKISIRNEDECWLWHGSMNSGKPRWNPNGCGLSPSVARVMYEYCTDTKIPDGIKLKRTCPEPRCCNPKHHYVELSTEGRFWSKVDKRSPGECWDWQGHIKKNGYGEFSLNHKTPIMAHRYSYMLANGLNELPEGMHIMHSCDRRSCVNPSHLSLGTAKENRQDCLSKGRSVFANGDAVARKGTDNGRAVLSEDDVRQIRSLLNSGITQKTIAKQFGVSPATVGFIAIKKIWKHI